MGYSQEYCTEHRLLESFVTPIKIFLTRNNQCLDIVRSQVPGGLAGRDRYLFDYYAAKTMPDEYNRAVRFLYDRLEPTTDFSGSSGDIFNPGTYRTRCIQSIKKLLTTDIHRLDRGIDVPRRVVIESHYTGSRACFR